MVVRKISTVCNLSAYLQSNRGVRLRLHNAVSDAGSRVPMVGVMPLSSAAVPRALWNLYASLDREAPHPRLWPLSGVHTSGLGRR
ncbi:MAG: hypothetical protein RL518_2795 [Pseudomonadota bacterium]